MKISAFTVAPRAFSFVNSLLFVNMPCHLTSTRLQSRGLWCFPLLLYASAAARPLPLSLSIASLSLSRASAARMRYCCCLCCCCGAEPRARPPARVPCAVARHGRAATSRADVCHFAPLTAGLARVAPGHASASHGVPQTRPAPPGLVPSHLAAAPFRGATTRHSRRRPNSPRSPLIRAPTAQIEHAITLHSIS